MTIEAIEKNICHIVNNSNNFYYNKYVVVPNAMGYFTLNNMWFVYTIDEKANESICGPFSDEGIIYAVAMKCHVAEEYSFFEFSEEEWNIYFDNHYHSILEVENKCKQTETSGRNYINSQDVWKKITLNIIENVKIPHSTSRPVLYQEDGNLFLAAFVFFYSKEDIENGEVDRPTFWGKFDITTGDKVEAFETREQEFSNAGYNIKYNVRSDKKYDTSKEYYEKAFNLLDKVRENYLKNGKILAHEYEQYMQMILKNIPKDYKRFYKDLSVM